MIGSSRPSSSIRGMESIIILLYQLSVRSVDDKKYHPNSKKKEKKEKSPGVDLAFAPFQYFHTYNPS